MNKKAVLTTLLLSLFLPPSFAQLQEPLVKEKTPKWYFGISEGFHSNFMRYSNLDDNMFPDNKNLNGGIFSFFVERDFGKQNQFSIRPEISFLKRGGKLVNIGKDIYDYKANNVDDIYYQLDSRYWDIRIPIIYNFGKLSSKIRPYIYVAPILAFPTRGDVKMEAKYINGYYEGYSINTSTANLASCYFAAAAGLGLKYQFRNSCFLGIEGSYEYGFSDTYGKKEKDGEAVNAGIFPEGTYITGNRKFSGIEIKATLGVPFSIFKKKAKATPVVPVTPIVNQIVKDTVVIKEKPCYTLEEIIEMVEKNESVIGKTICAIDVINFDFAKSDIKMESFEYLDKLAAILIVTQVRVEVKGHTDNVGSEEVNMELSKERAKAVVRYLIREGVDKDKISYSYYGMSKPLTTNDTEEGRTMNRRVEFEILGN